jgi:hypothetical protein
MVEGWRNSILAVAKEEMGHLLTVQNIAALLGGPVSLDREDYPWDNPFYPAPFTLAPLSLGSLAIYVFAEMPEVWEHDNDDKEEIIQLAQQQAQAFGGSSRPAVNRVGIIYKTLIQIIADHRCIPDAAFHADSVPQQASWDEWGRGYHGGPRGANVMVDVVATRDEALDALRKIASQGESPNARPGRTIFGNAHVITGPRPVPITSMSSRPPPAAAAATTGSRKAARKTMSPTITRIRA